LAFKSKIILQDIEKMFLVIRQLANAG